MITSLISCIEITNTVNNTATNNNNNNTANTPN